MMGDWRGLRALLLITSCGAAAASASVIEPPPDYVRSKSGAALALDAPSASALDLTADERIVATLLLEGSFSDDDAKVRAFDQAREYLGTLSHGRLYDFFSGLMQKQGFAPGVEPIHGIFMRDHEVVQEFRRNLLFSFAGFLDSGLDPESVRALKSLSELATAANESGRSGEAKAAMIARLESAQTRFNQAMSFQRDVSQAIAELKRGIEADQGLPPELRQELQALLDEAGIEDLYRLGLLSSEEGVPPALIDEFRKRSDRLKSALYSDASRLDELHDKWADFTKDLSERAKIAGRTGGLYREVLEQVAQLTWDGVKYDFLRNWKEFLDSNPGIGSLVQAEEIQRTLRNDADTYQRFFGELADLRQFLFSDPMIRKEYQDTVFQTLIQLIEFDPGDPEDSLAKRLDVMARAIRDSKMPSAAKSKLMSRVLGLGGLADKHSLAFRKLFMQLAEVRRAVGNANSTDSYLKLLTGYGEMSLKQIEDLGRKQILLIKERLAGMNGAADLLKQLAEIDKVFARIYSTPNTGQLIQELHQLRTYVRNHPELGKLQDAQILTSGALQAELQARLERIRARIQSSAHAGPIKKRMLARARQADRFLFKAARELDSALIYVRDARAGFEADAEMRRILGPKVTEKLDQVLRLDLKNVALKLAAELDKNASKLRTQSISRSSKLKVMNYIEPVFEHGIQQIENIADQVVTSGQIKLWSKEYQTFFNILFSEYYRRTQLEYKKDMLLGLLRLPPEAGFLAQLRTIVQESGPELQKMIQLFSKEKGMGEDFARVAKELEDGVKYAPFDQVHEAMLKRVPHIYPSRFRKFQRTPVKAGTMAQLHFAEFELDNGEVVEAAVRLIKPGIEDRVEEDGRILREIVPIAQSHPDIKGTALERIGNNVEALHTSIVEEMKTLPTAINQNQGQTVYSGVIEKKTKARFVKIEVVVPKIYNQDSLESGVHIQQVVKKVKLTDFFEHDPSTYRLVSEEIVRLWVREALFGTGFFHMDMHQGNFLVHRGDDDRIVLSILDFGMANTLTPDIRASFLKVSTAIKTGSVAQIFASVQSLLKEPMDDQILWNAIHTAIRRPDAGITEVIDEMVKADARLPNSLVDFNRGKWFIGQLLTDSGSQQTVDSIVTDVAQKEFMREAPSRIVQSAAGNIDARPKTGVPLTNREFAAMLGSEAAICIKNQLRSRK